jgi:hypothetical protein
VLDRVEKAGKGPARLNSLVPVSGTPPKYSGQRAEDIFQLTSHPKLLDLTNIDQTGQFAQLVEDVPLYGINLELTMDTMLTARHRDAKIDDALIRAFGRDPLPSSLNDGADSNQAAALRHPGLGYISKDRLSEIYVRFINYIAPYHTRDLRFDIDILGKHTEPFLDYFEGFVTPQGSKVKASLLLAFGIRLDHDPGKPLESYVNAGQKKAIKMRISDPREMLWAWLEADEHQMRHCTDLDRTLKLEGLPRRPNWVRYDVFSLLEKEAVKQRLAETYVKADPDLTVLAHAPQLKKAVKANAEGRVDETLQQLLSQTLNIESNYSGAAARFADMAAQRVRETYNIASRPEGAADVQTIG